MWQLWKSNTTFLQDMLFLLLVIASVRLVVSCSNSVKSVYNVGSLKSVWLIQLSANDWTEISLNVLNQ